MRLFSKDTGNRTRLSLGPVLFNWSAAEKADFYRRIADEAPIDTVYLGEVVCSKRMPLHAAVMPEIIDRLQRGGKEVVLSTLALIMTDRELEQQAAALADPSDWLFEANDVSALSRLSGRPHVVGPFVNIYNEGALAFAARRGAVRVVLGCEIPGRAIQTLLQQKPADLQIEIQAFGRLPLALSARCYHARHHGLHHDSCRYVCETDPDGLAVESLDDQPFLAINGTQSLSHSVCCLLDQAVPLQSAGVSHLRLWPHTCDMVGVAKVFRSVLDGTLAVEDGMDRLGRLVTIAPFANGFFFGQAGHRALSGTLVE